MGAVLEAEEDDDGVFYPDTDGEPMAESDFQRKPLTYAVEALALHFADRPDVYVSGNLLIYYKKGDNTVSVAPDVFVVFGVTKRDRNTYKTWVEGKAPDVVIEITSRKTRLRDEREKPEIYRQLGVDEYFQYDPTGDYLSPQIKGRRLDGGAYDWIFPRRLKGGGLAMESYVLGLELHLVRGELRLYDVRRKSYLQNYAEAVDAHKKARNKARSATRARSKAEKQREIEAQARAEAEAQRAEAERQREIEAQARTEAEARQAAEARARAEADAHAAEAEAHAAEAEAQRAAEAQARTEAEARLQEMEAEIQRLRGGAGRV
jgi:Uma2 family endonuclease